MNAMQLVAILLVGLIAIPASAEPPAAVATPAAPASTTAKPPAAKPAPVRMGCGIMTLDTRYDPARLLICDRNHAPKGRLLHYALDGNFLEEVATGLGMPTSASIQGDYVSVPDLHGRLVILDKCNTIMAVLGHNPDPAQGKNYNIPQDKWIEGVFSGTHGSAWDAEGNLYVQDWNVAGRIMKLVRVR